MRVTAAMASLSSARFLPRAGPSAKRGSSISPSVPSALQSRENMVSPDAAILMKPSPVSNIPVGM